MKISQSWAVAPYAVVVRSFRMSRRCASAPEHSLYLDGRRRLRRLRQLLRTAEDRDSHIDSLSAHGIRFTQMYTSAPLSLRPLRVVDGASQRPRRHPAPTTRWSGAVTFGTTRPCCAILRSRARLRCKAGTPTWAQCCGLRRLFHGYDRQVGRRGPATKSTG